MSKEIKLVFECEDINKDKFDVEYTFAELLNNLNRISKNGRVDKVKKFEWMMDALVEKQNNLFIKK